MNNSFIKKKYVRPVLFSFLFLYIIFFFFVLYMAKKVVIKEEIIYLFLILYSIFLFFVLYFTGKKAVIDGKIINGPVAVGVCLLLIIGGTLMLYLSIIEKKFPTTFMALTLIVTGLVFLLIFWQIGRKEKRTGSNEILVKFKDGISQAEIDAINIKYGTKEIKERPRFFSYFGIHRLKIPPETTSQAIVEKYQKEPEVEWVELHYFSRREALYQRCLQRSIYNMRRLGCMNRTTGEKR